MKLQGKRQYVVNVTTVIKSMVVISLTLVLQAKMDVIEMKLNIVAKIL
jgi:hypothetical protein